MIAETNILTGNETGEIKELDELIRMKNKSGWIIHFGEWPMVKVTFCHIRSK